MNRVGTRARPIAIALISIYFLLSAAYLWIVAVVLILAPGKLSLMLGSPFMHGLELAGPYMMLLAGCAYGSIGWGLYRLRNWARWLAMLVMVWGVGCLVPTISSAAIGLRVFVRGAEIAIFAAAGFYLAQAPTTLEAFVQPSSEKSVLQIYPDPQTSVRENRRDPLE
jgi:hypothetical protein